MAHKFKMSKDIADRIATLSSDLRAEAEEHRNAWDERTEKWQESDAGGEADSWIENLEELADALENIDTEPA